VRPPPVLVEALEARARRLVAMPRVPRHLPAALPLTEVRGQGVRPGHTGRRGVREGAGRLPHRETRGMEPGEGPDVLPPRPPPRGQRGPTPRRLAHIASDMRPARGPDDLGLILGEGFGGAGAGPDQHRL